MQVVYDEQGLEESVQDAIEASGEHPILIDKFLDDAIELVCSLAGIEKAQVVEYRKPFSLAHFLDSRSRGILKIDRAMLYELSTPQVLYLWTGY